MNRQLETINPHAFTLSRIELAGVAGVVGYGEPTSDQIDLVSRYDVGAQERISDRMNAVTASPDVTAVDASSMVAIDVHNAPALDLKELGLPLLDGTAKPIALVAVSNKDGQVGATSMRLVVDTGVKGVRDRRVETFLFEESTLVGERPRWVGNGDNSILCGRLVDLRVKLQDPEFEAVGDTGRIVKKQEVGIDLSGDPAELDMRVIIPNKERIQEKKEKLEKRSNRRRRVGGALGTLAAISLAGAAMVMQMGSGDAEEARPVPVTTTEAAPTTTIKIPEDYAHPEGYDPTGVLNLSDTEKYAVLTNFFENIATKEAPFPLSSLSGFELQRFENHTEDPFDRAAMVSIFNVDGDGVGIGVGSGFLSQNPEGEIKFTTIEHVADLDLDYAQDRQFYEQGSKRVIYIPGLDVFLDISDTSSSFFKTGALQQEGDNVASLLLPTGAQDALQVLQQMGEITPLTLADSSTILTEGRPVSMANVYGGGVTTHATIAGHREDDEPGQVNIAYDLSHFGIDPTATREDAVSRLQEYFGHTFTPDEDGEQKMREIVNMSCTGNSGAPVYTENPDGNRVVVGLIKSHEETDEVVIWGPSSEAARQGGYSVVAKYCSLVTRISPAVNA